MMKEIPHADWSRFVREFSRDHQGWLIEIEQRGAETGTHADVQASPLEGLTLHLDGSDEVLSIIGRGEDGPHKHLLYSVASPVRITLEQSSRNGKGKKDKRLHIESHGARPT